MVEYDFVRLILTVTLEELTANEIDLLPKLVSLNFMAGEFRF
jgi:hypothetical protein